MNIPTPTNVQDALATLGSTETQVADTLMLRGIRGHAGDASSCPIANYLRGLFPGFRFNICRDNVLVINEADRSAPDFDYFKVTNPVPVHDFIREFDRWYHLALDA